MQLMLIPKQKKLYIDYYYRIINVFLFCKNLGLKAYRAMTVTEVAIQDSKWIRAQTGMQVVINNRKSYRTFC